MTEQPERTLGPGARGENEPQPEYDENMVQVGHGESATTSEDQETAEAPQAAEAEGEVEGTDT